MPLPGGTYDCNEQQNYTMQRTDIVLSVALFSSSKMAAAFGNEVLVRAFTRHSSASEGSVDSGELRRLQWITGKRNRRTPRETRHRRLERSHVAMGTRNGRVSLPDKELGDAGVDVVGAARSQGPTTFEFLRTLHTMGHGSHLTHWLYRGLRAHLGIPLNVLRTTW
ncbi:hypothetical protein NDU88_000652 [Pleurodeles waltl]|uniref:Uncharacterized protein n=1 Tax=Pleurodeles waltl TaxID=8319 RepID=A0AAV7LXE9_PLEWA|nr:hypothetical protein NDU88_000652 [Pleurodeles waltl]